MVKETKADKKNRRSESRYVPFDDIVKIIEDSDYVWRTSKGIAKSLNVPQAVVAATIRSEMKNNKKNPIITGTKVSNSEEIYTTKSKYSKEGLLLKALDFSMGGIKR